jgi:hypothetical protein
MITYIFIWHTADAHRREYKTKALSSVDAQANFGTFQARKKTNRRFNSMWELRDGVRIKLWPKDPPALQNFTKINQTQRKA